MMNLTLIIVLLLIAACVPQDHSLHNETLSDVNADTTFYLFSHLEYIDTDNYLASGSLNCFLGCLESVTEERNAGGTDKRYFLSIDGKKRHYYSIRTIKEQIVRLSPMRKADVGFKGGGAMYRVSCDLKLLLQTSGK